MKATKIEKVETILWDRWLLVRIHCEDGTVGIGEGGVHGWQRPTADHGRDVQAVPARPGPLEDRAPLRSTCIGRSHFMGSVVGGAISAIDIALWDIKGKRLGVPIYDLMGGKTRDRVRCYIHVNGNDARRAGGRCRRQDAAEEGFTAVRFSAFNARLLPAQVVRRSGRTSAVERVARGARGGRAGRRHLRRDPPPDEPGRIDRARPAAAAVQPVLLRRPDAARQPGQDGRRPGAAATSRSRRASGSPRSSSSSSCWRTRAAPTSGRTSASAAGSPAARRSPRWPRPSTSR